MKQRLMTVLIVVAMSVICGYAQSGQSPTNSKQTPEDAQRVETGEITKIDVKKKVLTVRTVTETTPSRNPRQPQTSGQRRTRSGTGGGRGGRSGGGIPFPGGGGGRAPTPGSKSQGKQFKVTVNDKTTIKDDVTTISFDLLRVGDRVSVSGLPKGSNGDLQATEITVSR